MGDGWGNLREIREDPTPTAGLQRGGHCNVPTTLDAYRDALRSATPLRYRLQGRALSAISIAELPVPYAFTILVSTPYHRRTRAASCSDFATKSEDEATMVRRWYGDGAVQVGRIIGLRPYFRHCGGVGAACCRAQIWECGEGQIAMLHAAPLRPWERESMR
ncbi:MAG: hypothetical protein AL399_02045 [Candidatus [Bacteroides] periocalifornicus]|uniref:Uncharacterized protein n=1 Tax=Candidatus [Bacteroides] periocalifornicus TaxID=1702214 RepID=A0A0Q4BAI2_9BACT|nr:MAG: hypothetical protein AL399_02045 [Candidatus [Bacteroides] periocalifornicus]